MCSGGDVRCAMWYAAARLDRRRGQAGASVSFSGDRLDVVALGMAALGMLMAVADAVQMRALRFWLAVVGFVLMGGMGPASDAGVGALLGGEPCRGVCLGHAWIAMLGGKL